MALARLGGTAFALYTPTLNDVMSSCRFQAEPALLSDRIPPPSDPTVTPRATATAPRLRQVPHPAFSAGTPSPSRLALPLTRPPTPRIFSDRLPDQSLAHVPFNRPSTDARESMRIVETPPSVALSHPSSTSGGKWGLRGLGPAPGPSPHTGREQPATRSRFSGTCLETNPCPGRPCPLAILRRSGRVMKGQARLSSPPEQRLVILCRAGKPP